MSLSQIDATLRAQPAVTVLLGRWLIIALLFHIWSGYPIMYLRNLSQSMRSIIGRCDKARLNARRPAKKISFFYASRLNTRFYSDTPSEIISDPIEIQEKLLEFLSKPEGPGYESSWRGAPAAPLWDRFRSAITLDAKVGFGRRATVTYDAMASLIQYMEPAPKHLEQIFSDPDYVTKFDAAFRDVAAAISENDFDHLETIFGRGLNARLHAWRRKYEEAELDVKISVQSGEALDYATTLGMWKGNLEPALNSFTFNNLESVDVDYNLVGVPKITRHVQRIPQSWNRFSFFLGLRCGVVAFVIRNSGFQSVTLALYVLFGSKEKMEITHRPTGKVIWKDNDYVQKHHMWKFGTTAFTDSIQPWVIYDMNNIVQDSMDHFFAKENATGRIKTRPNENCINELLDMHHINDNWWIESRKFNGINTKGVFERSLTT